jgi:signal transduction histidine kinase
VRTAPLDASQRTLLAEHQHVLRESLVRSRQAGFVYGRAARAFAIAALVILGLLTVGASRMAGHLSRNLSRPLDELVGWTERIGRGESLPDTPPRRGAPEFAVLRHGMRSMSHELELGRDRALEAERAAAQRESARRMAHELKNPLTPIRFAVERLRRESPPQLADAVEVLEVESRRLETMARSFAQFGRLPEGHPSEVDVGELARYTARATVPPDVSVDVRVAGAVPMIRAYHDALARALANVMLNAVDACRDRQDGAVRVTVDAVSHAGADAVRIAVQDNGRGIPATELARVWEPYVTTKPGGTGLGLAIARQTILAHGGAVSAQSEPDRGTTIAFVLPVGGGASGVSKHD